MQSAIKKFAQFGTPETLPGRERKSKLTGKTARILFCEVNNNLLIVLDNIAKKLETEGTSVNKSIIQRCMNKKGLHCNLPRRTPLEKPCHITARLTFSKSHLAKDKGFWSQLLQSDETKFELCEHNNEKKI